MSNESLQLNKHWTLGEPLGDGGYGKVVAATGEDGTRAAVKLVPKKPGASRELLFVDLALPGQAVRNVVPVLDSGETEDAYAIVMPLAEESLRDRLESIGGPLSLEQALAVLTDVATAWPTSTGGWCTGISGRRTCSSSMAPGVWPTSASPGTARQPQPRRPTSGRGP